MPKPAEHLKELTFVVDGDCQAFIHSVMNEGRTGTLLISFNEGRMFPQMKWRGEVDKALARKLALNCD
jgi:hypothetical protein